MPQLPTEREVPQLSDPLTLPQSLAKLAQKAAFDSGLQFALAAKTLAVEGVEVPEELVQVKV